MSVTNGTAGGKAVIRAALRTVRLRCRIFKSFGAVDKIDARRNLMGQVKGPAFLSGCYESYGWVNETGNGSLCW